MLRDLMTGNGKIVPADYKAGAAMKTGMAVTKVRATKEAKFATNGTASEIYFVDKERVPTGTNCARGDMSDYDENFVDVAAGEFVKLKKYVAGETFGTDAKGVATIGKVVMAGTDGKLLDALTTVASPYLYVGDVDDNGHTLMQIEVLDTPIKNA